VPRDPGLYVDDMLEAIRRIASYTDGIDRPSFAQDPKTVDAVVRNLEILGEAAKCVPEELRRKAAEIDWRKVTGMRDVLAHAYFRIDLDILWDAATVKAPALMEPLRRLLADLGPA
jgi:uncharacterized protein with HEPN domain